MRRRKIDNQVERKLLTAMIVSKDFLAQAAPLLEKEALHYRDNPLFKEISEWCLAYWDEYHEAPKQVIESIYHVWADKQGDEPIVEDVHDLLDELSGDYEDKGELNISFLMDSLSEFLTKKKLQHLNEELEAALSRGDTEACNSIINDYRSADNSGKGSYADPVNDDAAWKDAFAASNQPLLHFPGAAGRFLNSSMIRDAVILFQAPEKTGKTFWLMEVAMQALRERRKILFVQAGDLSQPQMLKRFGSRWAGIPEKREDCKGVMEPIEIARDEDEEIGVKIKYFKQNFKGPITYKRVKLARKQLKRAYGLPSLESYIKLATYPSDSINIAGITSLLEQLEYEEGFIADIVIIDYMDILAPEKQLKDGRDMLDATGKAMRKLAGKKHVLVVSATQSNALAYDAKTQSKKHFSNDKRKLAHVHGMIGINQTNDEKDAQIQRLNWIVNRSSPWNAGRCLYVGNCLALGRALCVATL